MTSQRSSRLPSQPLPSSPRRPPTGWRAVLIGVAFGFSAGFLFAIGIVSLIYANSAPNLASSPVGNGAASASVTPALTPTPLPTPTATPFRPPTPTATPIPIPTPTPSSGAIVLRADDPTFYITAFIIFLVLCGVILLRSNG